jgi:hypothetical protein
MSTCVQCKNWVAKDAQQHATRLRNIRNNPYVTIHPCPTCGSSDWATELPPVPQASRAFLGAGLRTPVEMLYAQQHEQHMRNRTTKPQPKYKPWWKFW